MLHAVLHLVQGDLLFAFQGATTSAKKTLSQEIPGESNQEQNARLGGSSPRDRTVDGLRS
jgi:hypothetical protein